MVHRRQPQQQQQDCCCYYLREEFVVILKDSFEEKMKFYLMKDEHRSPVEDELVIAVVFVFVGRSPTTYC